MKFYGNANRKCLMEMGSNILCSRSFEENKDNNNDANFDDFRKMCLIYVLKAVSCFFYVLEEKCN